LHSKLKLKIGLIKSLFFIRKIYNVNIYLKAAINFEKRPYFEIWPNGLDELACHLISFDLRKDLEENCFLFTNIETETSRNQNFVSELEKK
jgi:hypothetical protein